MPLLSLPPLSPPLLPLYSATIPLCSVPASVAGSFRSRSTYLLAHAHFRRPCSVPCGKGIHEMSLTLLVNWFHPPRLFRPSQLSSWPSHLARILSSYTKLASASTSYALPLPSFSLLPPPTCPCSSFLLSTNIFNTLTHHSFRFSSQHNPPPPTTLLLILNCHPLPNLFC